MKTCNGAELGTACTVQVDPRERLTVHVDREDGSCVELGRG